MKPGSRHRTPSVSDAVRRAISACDPDDHSEAVVGLLESFEDDDRPAPGVDDLAEELRSTAEGLDPDVTEPELWLAAATANWLATNPGDFEQPEHAIQEGARLFFGDTPPESVERWLVAHNLD